MPLFTHDQLVPGEPLRATVHALAQAKPGLVLSVGAANSGKLTLLLALAPVIAAQRPVLLLSDHPDHYAPFGPLPGHWEARLVAPAAWGTALATAPADAIVVVAPLGAANAAAAVALARNRWVLAALEDGECGVDVVAALDALRVDRNAFADAVRVIWCQFLVPGLCGECALPAPLADDELRELLAATATTRADLRVENGCAACGGSGTRGREAVCDVLVVDDALRPALRRALADGMPLAAGGARRTALAEARDLLRGQLIGVGTYRDALRAHPWLRAQAAAERSDRARR
jgi:general secretion pathway protein E